MEYRTLLHMEKVPRTLTERILVGTCSISLTSMSSISIQLRNLFNASSPTARLILSEPDHSSRSESLSMFFLETYPRCFVKFCCFRRITLKLHILWKSSPMKPIGKYVVVFVFIATKKPSSWNWTFTSRRRRPRSFRSDNCTNLVRSARVLKEAW